MLEKSKLEEAICIDEDVLKRNENGIGAYECKNNNGESNFNKKVTQKQTQLFIHKITEKNKPNLKMIAETLKILYEQGVRVK